MSVVYNDIFEEGDKMAGQRQPIKLVKAKGKKHLTKKEIKEREESELKVPIGKIEPPDYLPEKLQEEFKDISQKLINIEIMTELDIDLLARYLLSKQAYLAFTSKMLKANKQDDPQIEKIVTMQDKAFKQCQSAARDLGLTISSRCKLTLPKQAKKEKPTGMEAFMKKRG